MSIIRMVFWEPENRCEMYVGGKKVETYTYDEGEIVLSGLKLLKIAKIIDLDIEYI